MFNVSVMPSSGTCDWCESSREREQLPTAFCWTKMQAEAGQPLDTILFRKELERTAGNGVFMWGIGNAVTAPVQKLLAREPSPRVLFSVMKSKAKRKDAEAESLFIWTSYLDTDGAVCELPRHALVLSRATTDSGAKTHHYALVCHSTEKLAPKDIGVLNLGHLRNLNGGGNRVGFSQVTAVVEHVPSTEPGLTYEVSFLATLVAPYAVRLAEPRLFSSDDQRALESFLASTPTASVWKGFVESLRDRYQ